MRGLSTEFMTALKEGGILFPILKAVQTDKDFIMEIREDYINIYYKGGSILKLTRQGNEYTASFEIKYAKDNPKRMEVEECLKTNKITALDEAEKWADNIRFFKSIMDYHSSIAANETLEKNIQQLIVQENNNWRTSNSTDYFIIDFEYANTQYDTRFDLVGLFWEGDRNIRRNPKDCRLVIIEVKYGDKSLVDKSGLTAHIKKAEKFLDDEKRVKDFKEEMVTIFKQKRELGVLNIENPHEVPIEAIDDSIDFLFIIAGHNPGSTVLKRELDNMKTETKKTNVQFATSSFAGYALFKENIKTFDEFMKLLE
jgi:hypothetical protein